MNSPLFISAIVAVVIVGAVDLIAVYLHLFYSIMWFDMVMHFLGGFLISLGTLSLATYNNHRFSYGQLLLYGIGTALVAGLLWEGFELHYGITYWYSPDYLGDNGMDVVMDVTGGLVAVWYAYIKLRTPKL